MIRMLNQAKFEMRNFRDRPVPSEKFLFDIVCWHNKWQNKFLAKRIWANSGVGAAFENGPHRRHAFTPDNVNNLHCLVWRNFFYLVESLSFWYLLSEIDYRFYNEL